MDNLALGYIDYDEPLRYDLWCETFGKYRWYHEDGTPRTIYPLDYNWKEIYDIACKSVDLRFASRIIEDVELFTEQFLGSIPENWFMYKTELELFSGQLDGDTINPDMFEQGFERTTTSTTDYSGKGDGDYTDGERVDSDNTDTARDLTDKARSINYQQGVQAYDNEINNDNIGELGNDYASAMNDAVDKQNENVNTNNRFNKGEQTNNYNNRLTTNEDFNEHIKETRINFYDNLAFLRDRFDRIVKFKPFYRYFEEYFTSVTSLCGWWKDWQDINFIR